jgi:hypothetical protein
MLQPGMCSIPLQAAITLVKPLFCSTVYCAATLTAASTWTVRSSDRLSREAPRLKASNYTASCLAPVG